MYLDFTRRTQRCSPCRYPRTSKILKLSVYTVTIIYRYTLPRSSQWENSIQVEVIQTQHQFIHMHIQTLGGDLWVLSMGCGSPKHHLRKSLRHTLNHNTLNTSKLWMTTGDFNVVRIWIVEDVRISQIEFQKCNSLTWVLMVLSLLGL